jgi:cytochrome oxidase Cu insertion factor (SCO1/SenC/PrrC family)
LRFVPSADQDANVNHLHRPLALLAGLVLAASAQATWTSGQTPADFTLVDWNGQSWNLYAQRGKVVLLNFGATW